MLPFKIYHHLLMEQPELPEMPGPLTYVIAGNGVFLWGRREGLEALISLAPTAIRDLYPVDPFVRIAAPSLPACQLAELLALARQARDKEGMPLESLFYPSHTPGAGWRLLVPPQERRVARVRPLAGGLADYAQVWWEIHSHHDMSAFFSTTDDADEVGFRLYGVVGHIFTRPQMRLRVGIYGHYWEFPASMVCMLPEGLLDVADRDDDVMEGEQERMEGHA